MKVYIAERGFDYEGFQIMGVYTTREDAQEKVEQLPCKQ